MFRHGMKTGALILLLLPVVARGAELTCKRSPALTGKCTMTQGSLGLTPGVGVTLMTADGRRIRITAPPDSDADIAPRVMQNWLYWQSKTGSMNTRITGSYEVCPLPAQANAAGISDFACINNGTRITEDKAGQ